MNRTNAWPFLVPAITLLMCPANPAQAQEALANDDPEPPFVEEQEPINIADEALPKMVVTATRTETPLLELTRSVTLVDEEAISQQLSISPDIGDVLGKTVPGMGTSTEGLTNFTQTLRGRKFLTMVDGIPISTPLRDGARDLKVIDPAALERVEVVRGGTAAYGFGATGGLVHYITRDPVPEEFSAYSDFGMRFSTEHSDDSLEWHTSHGASGRLGPFDVLVHGGVAERNSFFDADGDRIPPNPLLNQGGLADTLEWNILTKIGLDFDDQRQRLELTFNYYDIEQDTDFVTQFGNYAAGRKAVGVAGDQEGPSTMTKNELVSLTYGHDDFFGSELQLQAYHLDYAAVFPRVPPAFGSVDAQLSSEKIGSRATLTTPLHASDAIEVDLTWGIDYLNERTSQTLGGPNTFGVASIPELDQDAVAGFAEIEAAFTGVGRVRAGVRREEFSLSVPTFSGPGGTVQGGDLNYDETLFNATAALYLTDEIELFGGFSQGFSLAEIGRILRERASTRPGGGGRVEDIDPSPQKVDNYELGMRGAWDGIRGSLVGFYSESDLGTSFDPSLQVIRQPEEIFGVELSLEADLNERWTLGGTATWMESNTDDDGDGDLDEELPNTRIPPLKLTGFMEYTPFDGWSNRLQVLYSGNRDPDSAVFGSAEVDSFVTLDFLASIEAGPGEIQLAIENLLNEDYFPVAAQAFGIDSTYSKGIGRTFSLGYRIDW